MDKEALKSRALVERLTQVVAEYEERMVDMRVEVTLLVKQSEEEKNGLLERIRELEAMEEAPEVAAD